VKKIGNKVVAAVNTTRWRIKVSLRVHAYINEWEIQNEHLKNHAKIEFCSSTENVDTEEYSTITPTSYASDYRWKKYELPEAQSKKTNKLVLQSQNTRKTRNKNKKTIRNPKNTTHDAGPIAPPSHSSAYK
jgi:hypothetical protein